MPSELAVDQQIGVRQQLRQRAPGRAIASPRAELRGETLGALERAIDDDDLLDPGRNQPLNDGARRAAGAKHDGAARPAAPFRRLLVEIGEKAGDIGIVAAQLAVVAPQRVDRAEVGGIGGDPIAGGEGRLLMRDA